MHKKSRKHKIARDKKRKEQARLENEKGLMTKGRSLF